MQQTCNKKLLRKLKSIFYCLIAVSYLSAEMKSPGICALGTLCHISFGLIGKYAKSVCLGLNPFGIVAVSAEYRFALARLKRNFCFLAALGAYY